MNNEDVNHDSWRKHASEYERGFIDGMQRQAQSSVDKAVNAMSQRKAEILAEREACAKVCEDHQFASIGLAAAIRARGNT